MQVTTGYGYFKDVNNHIISKYIFTIGEHADPMEGLTQVEVESQSALDAIQIYTPTPTAVDLFSVDIFVQGLLVSFGSDDNILAFYAVVKDLAAYKNFTAMKNMMAGLLAAGKITQTESDTFNTVLAQQNIALINF